MKNFIGFLLISALSLTAQNYLQNPKFENNAAGWSLSENPLALNSGFSMEGKNGELHFEIKNPSVAGFINICQKHVKLPAGAEGRFSFELDAEYGSHPCWFTIKCGDAFLHHQPVRVEKGHNVFHFDFYTPSSEKKTVDADVYWSIGNLKGKNILRNPTVTAVPEESFLPYTLAPIWNLQDGIHYTGFPMRKPFVCKEKKTREIFNVFQAERDGVIRMGLALDGDCSILVNGKKIRSIANSRIRSRNNLLSDQIIHLPVQKGENEVRIVFAAVKFFCGKPEKIVAFQNGKGYRYIDTTDLYIKPGSALDLSSIRDRRSCAEQGKLGINTVGEYIFLKSGKKARFYGDHPGFSHLFKLSVPEFREAVGIYIANAQRQGFNYVRLELSDLISGDSSAENGITEDRLERTHYLLSELSKHGIFVNLLITAPTLFGTKTEKDRNQAKIYANRLMMYLHEPEIEKNWKNGVKYLGHVGKTTKTAIKDYPCIISIECFNEQYAGLILIAGIRQRFPKQYALFQKAWDAYLETVYKKPFKNTPLPKKNQKYYNDYSLFCEKLVRDLNEWYVRELREVGWDGIVVQNNYKNLLFRSAAWSTLSGLNDHSYYEHPTAYLNRGSFISNKSSIEKSANYIREMASGRFDGRPFFIGEINHSHWNPYLYEFGPMLGAYASYQGFSGFNTFCNNVIKTTVQGYGYLGNFGGGNPVARGSGVLIAYLFGRGDVRPSSHRVQVHYTDSYLYQNGNALLAPSSEQSKLMLLSHYSIAFPDHPVPNTVYPGTKADFVLSPGEVASITDHGWFSSVNDTRDNRFSLEEAVQEMRTRGLLPKENRTDVSSGVFESDTGEILMKTKEKQLLIRTPYSEVFVSPAGNRAGLGALTVLNSSVNATVGLVSQDALPLNESRRMLLVYTTRASSEEMRLSSDQQTMVFHGLTKVLLQTGSLDAELRNNSTNLAMYALSLNGSRLERIPLKKENGIWKIRIDTAKIKREPAVFFEIVEQK